MDWRYAGRLEPRLQVIGDEPSLQIAPDAHALLILDRAGWHTTGKLEIPTNITLLPFVPTM